MSKKVFSIFMPIEFLVALIAAALLFSDVGAIIYLIAAAVFCAVLAPFFAHLKKEQDEAKKRKIRPLRLDRIKSMIYNNIVKIIIVSMSARR